jgi:DnaJ-class molecular chaperone
VSFASFAVIKSIMAKDFYTILGVDRKADEKEIKRAYRKLARQYHPDANKGKDAEAKFKEISEAYQVLSDSEKRGLYDQFGENYDKVGQGAPPPGASGYPGGAQYSQYGGAGGINFEDLLNQARRQQAGARGASQAEVEDGDIGDIFSTIFGGRAGGGSTPRGGGFNFRSRRGPQKGQDVEQPIEISLGESIRGATRALQMVISDPTTGAQQHRNVTVKIPAGVREGARVRVREQGATGGNGGPNGDLYLKIRIAPHPFWKREGDNLRCEIPITFTEAALGATIEVPTANGSVKMKIPAGTQSGQTFRLSGRGVPRPKGGTGDLFVKVKVTVPKNLQGREAELIQELSRQREQNVRANLPAAI